MCSFVSWIEYKNNIIYLNDDCLKEKKGRELKKHLGENYYSDVKGHEAIRWYFDMNNYQGTNKESESINPKDYPEKIVKDIKNCKMTLIGYSLRFLTDFALKDCLAIIDFAYKDYEAIKNPAWKDYLTIKNSAEKKYLAIRNSAWKDYLAIRNSAWKNYLTIENFACKDYLAIEKSAYEKYLIIINPVFWKLFKIKKNRIKQWQ